VRFRNGGSHRLAYAVSRTCFEQSVEGARMQTGTMISVP
jgi:hypothetical protein